MTPQERRAKAKEIREEAAQIAYNRGIENQEPNQDESVKRRAMSFTKGLAHDYRTGLLKSDDDFEKFKAGIESGNPQDFIDTPLGPQPEGAEPRWRSTEKAEVRAWESAGAGLTFDLEGPDAQSVAMKKVPQLGTEELIAEMGEVYAQALLRDVPFSVYHAHANSTHAQRKKLTTVLNVLNSLEYFLSEKRNGKQLNASNAFRGFTDGDLNGPYISQFLLAGNTGLNQNGDNTPEFDASDGQINFGAQIINQKVRRAKEINYMSDWDSWFDVQNGANFGGMEEYRGNDRRFITTPRDLSTYVHYDALYQAYLNACLLLLSAPIVGDAPRFDSGIPFQQKDSEDHQQGFAQFGGPHILTLVTEVATRALKAVRYQKFNQHRRLRPEALAARFEKWDDVRNALNQEEADADAISNFQTMFDALENSGVFNLLREENGKNLLLPMAFAEGSPMHPSYGAGHATVAGACVTILKAFFNHELYLRIAKDGSTFELAELDVACNSAFIPNATGNRLITVETTPLTVLGELNKVAANISIGRDWAGVHYYSDYTESMLLGEKIAIALLEEQAITYNPSENFKMTLVKFDGSEVEISA